MRSSPRNARDAASAPTTARPPAPLSNSPPNLNISEMKRVPQLDENGCGIACVAMLANVSYDEARRAVGSTGNAAAKGIGQLWNQSRSAHQAKVSNLF